MRSRGYNLDFSKNILLPVAVVMFSSILSLDMLTDEARAASDEFGIEQLYSTAGGGDAPVWFLNSEDPEEDMNFLMTSHEDIELEEEDSGVFRLDAETGTQRHEVRIHADSPDDEWRNVEMTGYFKLEEGNDQFTLVARQGPTYNDDGGCGAYGYYGMLSAEGDAFFKKKLFHHGGYTDRTAVEENVVDDLENRWVGLKLVVYDLDEGEDVKLELWVDDGNEENNWRKATEYVDDGDWETNGSDCDRDSDDTIDEGTRGGFRVDDSEFEFKKLSIREIDADNARQEGEEREEESDEEETGAREAEVSDEIEALADLKQLADVAQIEDVEELQEIAEATDVEELGDIADVEELEELEQLEEIARVPDLDGLAELVGASDPEELLELVIPQPLVLNDEEEED